MSCVNDLGVEIPGVFVQNVGRSSRGVVIMGVGESFSNAVVEKLWGSVGDSGSVDPLAPSRLLPNHCTYLRGTNEVRVSEHSRSWYGMRGRFSKNLVELGRVLGLSLIHI